jgi:hypothetical protein
MSGFSVYLSPMPDIGQLTPWTDDQQPSENAPNDCGPMTLAAALFYLTNTLWLPDTIHDSSDYGMQGVAGYTTEYQMQNFSRHRGGTDATIYYPAYGDFGGVAKIIRSYLLDGRPIAVLRYATNQDRVTNGPGRHFNLVRGITGPDYNHTDSYTTRDPYGASSYDRLEGKDAFMSNLPPYDVSWNSMVPWSLGYLLVGFERRRSIDATSPLFTPQG